MKHKREKTAKELANLSDHQIDFSDIPPLNGDFMRYLKLLKPAHRRKPVTLRLDEDMLQWFKAQGGSYQAHMQTVLRAYMFSQTNA